MNRLRRDIQAALIAAFGAISTLTLNPQFLTSTESSHAVIQASEVVGDLLDVEEARAEGAWWVDGDAASNSAQLSVDPSSDRLVWRVEGPEDTVLLDARTGEAVEFIFD